MAASCTAIAFLPLHPLREAARLKDLRNLQVVVGASSLAALPLVTTRGAGPAWRWGTADRHAHRAAIDVAGPTPVQGRLAHAMGRAHGRSRRRSSRAARQQGAPLQEQRETGQRDLVGPRTPIQDRLSSVGA